MITDVLAIRKHYRAVISDSRPQTFRMLEEHNGQVLVVRPAQRGRASCVWRSSGI